MSSIKYFLAQDKNKNWYCLPECHRQTWNRLIQKDFSENYDGWRLIENYRVDITTLSFENPIWR